jgi:hypothetical protein
MPIIPALRKVKQEDCVFEANLDYIVTLCLKKENKKTTSSVGSFL